MSSRAIFSNVQYIQAPSAEEPEIYTFSSSDTDTNENLFSPILSQKGRRNSFHTNNDTMVRRLQTEMQSFIDNSISNRFELLEERVERLEIENTRLIIDNKLLNESIQILLASNTELRMQSQKDQRDKGERVAPSRKRLKSRTKRAKILEQENLSGKEFNNSVISNDNLNEENINDINLYQKTKKLNLNPVLKEQNENRQTKPIISTNETSAKLESVQEDICIFQPNSENKNICLKSSEKNKAILGRTGTLRGFEDSVKNKISDFKTQYEPTKLSKKLAMQISSEKANEDKNFSGKLVLYTSSLGCIGERSNKCHTVQQILWNRMVKFEEKDIYLDPAYGEELRERLAEKGRSFDIPVVFLRGELLGGADKIVELNEDNSLEKMLKGFEKKITGNCDSCGSKRFILCSWCHGTKKGLRNSFGELRCTICNVNGLQVCPDCSV